MDVLVDFMKRNSASVALVQAGIDDVIAQAIRTADDGDSVLAVSHVFTNPDELRQLLSINNLNDRASLRDLALQAAQTTCEDSKASAGIAIVSLPDVDEDEDIAQGTAIAIYTDQGVRERVYGFGAQSVVARDWVRSWSLSAAWRLLREKLDDKSSD